MFSNHTPFTDNDTIRKKLHSLSHLRILALSMILYDHLGGMRGSEWIVKRFLDFILCRPLHIIQDFGALGVSLFYLLTGYLFLHTNQRKDRCTASVCRKVLRLYLFTMISMILFGVLQYGLNLIHPTYWAQFTLRDWIGCATLFYHFNGMGEMINGTTWFLIPLFIFYLLAAVCYDASGKDTFRFMLLLESCTTVLVFLGIWLQDQAGAGYLCSLIPFLYIPVIGIVLYVYITQSLSYLQTVVVGGISYLIMTVSFYRFNQGYYQNDPYMISILYAILLLLLFVSAENAFREHRCIVFLERISLSVYLVHMTWGGLSMSLLEPQIGFTGAFIVTLALVIFVAWLHYNLIEKGIFKKTKG